MKVTGFQPLIPTTFSQTVMSARPNHIFQTAEDDEGYTMTSDIVPKMTNDVTNDVTMDVDRHSKSDHIYSNDVSRGEDDNIHTNESGYRGKFPNKTGSDAADHVCHRTRRCDVITVVVGVLAGLGVALVMSAVSVAMVTSLHADMADLKSKFNDQVGN